MLDVLRATLANGLRVVIVPNDLAPVVTTEVNYLVGSNEAPDGFPGNGPCPGAHDVSRQPGVVGRAACEHYRLDGRQFQRRYAADRDPVFSYRAQGRPRCRAEGGSQCACAASSTSEELWAQERGAIEQEVAQDLSNPEYVFSMTLLENLFSNTPYATMPWARGLRSTKRRVQCSRHSTTRGMRRTTPFSSSQEM